MPIFGVAEFIYDGFRVARPILISVLGQNSEFFGQKLRKLRLQWAIRLFRSQFFYITSAMPRTTDLCQKIRIQGGYIF